MKDKSSQETVAALQEALELKQRQLELVLGLDQIRDSAPDPPTMLTSIVNLLTEQLQADLCLLALLDQETGQVQLKAINDKTKQPLKNAQQWAEKAVYLNQIEIWDGSDAGEDKLPAGLQLAAVPIIMGEEERLGALLLGRKTGFSANDVKLLKTAESMIDSAVVQGYNYYELKQHIKELEAIYKIDHIRDQGLPFDEMLSRVLQEVCRVINTEVGFTMLYDKTGRQLEMRAATNDDLFKITTHQKLVNQLATESLHKPGLVCRNDLGDRLRALMCLPLILNNEIIGVLGVINHAEGRGFNHNDRQLLTAIGSQIDTAIFENLERRRLRQVLGRSVDPRVMERLLANPDVDFLKGERSVLTVLYADLRGSTQLAEQTDPELLVGFINHYLGQMTEIILEHEGTLDKFVGDEVMALFGAPFPQVDHALKAVRVGLQMQQAHQTVVDIWRDRGVPATPVGVGIATGEMTVGEMGCTQRADYTVIGKAANLGARICSAAKAGEVLISEETYQLVKDKIEATAVTGLQFKGVKRDVTVYRVSQVFD